MTVNLLSTQHDIWAMIPDALWDLSYVVIALLCFIAIVWAIHLMIHGRERAEEFREVAALVKLTLIPLVGENSYQELGKTFRDHDPTKHPKPPAE